MSSVRFGADAAPRPAARDGAAAGSAPRSAARQRRAAQRGHHAAQMSLHSGASRFACFYCGPPTDRREDVLLMHSGSCPNLPRPSAVYVASLRSGESFFTSARAAAKAGSEKPRRAGPNVCAPLLHCVPGHISPSLAAFTVPASTPYCCIVARDSLMGPPTGDAPAELVKQGWRLLRPLPGEGEL